MGQNGHLITFPIDHGKTLNLFACYTNPNDWPSNDGHLTLPATREEALEDFKHFGPSVIKLLKMTEENLDRVCVINIPVGNIP
jgi:salicylate hydroxylase